MGADKTFRLRDRLRRAFRRREIFLRGEDRIRYIAISPMVQIVAASAALSVILFAGFGLLGTALYRDAATSREEVLAQARSDYWSLLRSLEALSENVAEAESNQAGTSGALVRDMVRQEMDRFRALFPEAAEIHDGEAAALAGKLLRTSVPDGLLLAEAHSRLLRRAQQAALAGESREQQAELLEQAVELDPQHSTAHRRLALLYAALGRDTDAQREFRRARDTDGLTHRRPVNTSSRISSLPSGAGQRTPTRYLTCRPSWSSRRFSQPR